jgi:hypothetical protein
LTYNEYKRGDRDSPCISPTEHSKNSEHLPFNFTHDFILPCIDLITFDNFPLIPHLTTKAKFVIFRNRGNCKPEKK